MRGRRGKRATVLNEASAADSNELTRCRDIPANNARRNRAHPASFIGLIGELWRKMDEGGFSAALRATVRKFNGGLFAPGPHGAAEPLPVDADMLELLIHVARRDWADVEPAIFGTLLENALNGRQRAELGAHFTPRSFVERLVLPTVMEPLRIEWDGAKAGA
jgi:hypothetical protein